MKTEMIVAEKFYDTSEDYPDQVELKVGASWLVIDQVSNRKIVNGSWISSGDVIYITCGDIELVYHLMEELTIRYDDSTTETNRNSLDNTVKGKNHMSPFEFEICKDEPGFVEIFVRVGLRSVSLVLPVVLPRVYFNRHDPETGDVEVIRRVAGKSPASW